MACPAPVQVRCSPLTAPVCRSLHHIDDEDYADLPAPQNTKKASRETAENAASDETAADTPADKPADNGPVGFAPLKDDKRNK